MSRESPSTQREREKLHAQVAAFAAKFAGTDLDLDKHLEQAGIEVIEAETAQEREEMRPWGEMSQH